MHLIVYLWEIHIPIALKHGENSCYLNIYLSVA